MNILIKEDNYWGNTGEVLSYSDVGESNSTNTDHPFYKYGASIASTRSESRILRKLLRLKTCAYEEISDVAEQQIEIQSDTNEWCPTDKISFEQKNTISLLAKRCDVDVLKFINSGQNQYNNIDEVTKEIGVKMIKYLNGILQGEFTNPNIGGYQENWDRITNV